MVQWNEGQGFVAPSLVSTPSENNTLHRNLFLEHLKIRHEVELNETEVPQDPSSAVDSQCAKNLCTCLNLSDFNRTYACPWALSWIKALLAYFFQTSGSHWQQQFVVYWILLCLSFVWKFQNTFISLIATLQTSWHWRTTFSVWAFAGTCILSS